MRVIHLANVEESAVGGLFLGTGIDSFLKPFLPVGFVDPFGAEAGDNDFNAHILIGRSCDQSFRDHRWLVLVDGGKGHECGLFD